jgi:hypothetical protein
VECARGCRVTPPGISCNGALPTLRNHQWLVSNQQCQAAVPAAAPAAPAVTLQASTIGLQPVHLHRLPSRPATRASAVGCAPAALQRCSAAAHATEMPGVQKPHCEPWRAAIASAAGTTCWVKCQRQQARAPDKLPQGCSVTRQAVHHARATRQHGGVLQLSRTLHTMKALLAAAKAAGSGDGTAIHGGYGRQA